MIHVETKAYFLFLKYILNFFNAFNAFFQSTETRIHQLQIKSENFLSHVCKNSIKPEYLKNVAGTINLSEKEIQKSEIFLGSECEDYLETVVTEDNADTVAIVRQNCLQFYITAAEEIRKRLPVNNDFLKKLQVLEAYPSLYDEEREISLKDINFVATTLGFDDEYLKQEWLTLPGNFTVEEKKRLSNLNFDQMWKEILQQRPSDNNYKYPALTNLLNAIRALPNSNADPERTFSMLTDLKSKKRNRLSFSYVNAVCVLKSALKTRGETAINIKITEQHLDRMTHDKLYAASSTKTKSSLNQFAEEEEEEAAYNLNTPSS